MFGKWLRRRKEPATKMPPIAPEQPFVAIGDVHGQFHLLERLLSSHQTLPIVCVGDYIDRGDRSAEVLRLLQDRTDITSLMGNHEEMMLGFLDKPEAQGPRWLRNGGLQTLASFGVPGVSESAHGADLIRIRDALAEAMGPALIDWMRRLPTHYRNGNVAAVHAAADPELPLAEQDRSTLLWGHAEFGKTARQDGLWIVHGHTIVDAPEIGAGVISIDTGAYATARLTAATVTAEGVTFSVT